MDSVRGAARRDFAVVRDGRATAAMERWVATAMRASKDKVKKGRDGVKFSKTSVQAGILVYISKPLIALLFKHFRSGGRVSLRKHRTGCDDPSLRAHPPCEMQPGGGNSGHSNEVGGRRSVTVRH